MQTVRLMPSVTRFIEKSLRRTVNPHKRVVDRLYQCKFMGFTVSRQNVRLKLADTPSTCRTTRYGPRPVVPEAAVC